MASGRPVSDSIAGLSGTLIQEADVFVTNLTKIISTVDEVTPDDESVDLGDLQNAEEDLATAKQTLEEFETSMESARNILRTCVQGLGAVIIACAVFGLLTLAIRRVRTFCSEDIIVIGYIRIMQPCSWHARHCSMAIVRFRAVNQAASLSPPALYQQLVACRECGS